jgi:hypothetical protein
VLVVSALLSGQGSASRADEKDATPILDKAIAALGGEAKLAKSGAATWKTKGTITFNDNTSPVKGSTAVEGIDKHRAEFEMEFDGSPFKGLQTGDDLRRLQGLRRPQAGHEDRKQARRQPVHQAGGHRLQGRGQARTERLRRAELSPQIAPRGLIERSGPGSADSRLVQLSSHFLCLVRRRMSSSAALRFEGWRRAGSGESGRGVVEGSFETISAICPSDDGMTSTSVSRGDGTGRHRSVRYSAFSNSRISLLAR